MERNVLVGGSILTTHKISECRGPHCTIHNLSEHHMVLWTQSWNPDDRRMERICFHGQHHPDPDEINPDKKHTCDGCCEPSYPLKEDLHELNKNYTNSTI
jgi:hypothetical protein